MIYQQGESDVSNQQSAPEDRYYNNDSFQNEYSANEPDVNNAVTKIQAQYRGYKVRRDLEKMKEENKQFIDTDQQELGYDYGKSTRPDDEYQKSSLDKQQNDDEEAERAAIAIQAQFRGYQIRKNLRQSSENTKEDEQEQDNDKLSRPIDFTGLGENIITHDEGETEENDDINRARLQRESTQLSDDFERHTQIPRDSNFAREQLVQILDQQNDDMDDSNLDKAATRIQASYRGYKIRKELGSNTSSMQHQSSTSSTNSSPKHQPYDNTRNKNILSPSAEGNKVPTGEHDDNAAAAVKIQAAYRGYRVRKELEK